MIVQILSFRGNLVNGEVHGLNSLLPRLPDKFLNFNLHGGDRVGHRSNPGDSFPALVDNKLGEIPLDPGTQEAALLLLQPFPQWRRVFAIDIHLGRVKIDW